MSSNHMATLLSFSLAWITASVAVYVWLSILLWPARIAWTSLASLFLVVALFALYVHLCPNFVVNPISQSFGSSNDLYIFRFTNNSGKDLYANAFVFNVYPSSYSANDFDVQIETRFLHPLEQQSADSPEKVADIFAVSGRNSDEPALIVYIYHLVPNETREVDLKFNGYIIPDSPVRIVAKILSYSEIDLPISKEGDIVNLPVGVTAAPLAIDRMFSCFIRTDNSANPCSFHPVRSEGSLTAVGCYYIAFVKGRNLPARIPSPNSGSCDISKFKTWNFSW